METAKNKQYSVTNYCNIRGKNGAGSNSQNATAYLIHSFLLVVALCLPPPASSYTMESSDGNYIWYIEYYQSYEEAKAECNAFYVAHGYPPVCDNGGQNYIVGGGWLYEYYPDTIFPLHAVSFHYNPVCPPPLVFTKDQGCINKDDSCPVSNPINIGIGNKRQTETDFIGVGAFPLSVVRTFRSVGNRRNSRNQQWQFFSQLVIAPGISTVVVRPDGRRLLFTPDGAGGWLSDPDITGVLESIDDAGVQTGWRYTTLDQHVEIFDINGDLLSVTNRAGLTHTYVHAAADITITHSNGDVLVYQILGGPGIIGFTTPDNEQYNYVHSYHENNLISVTYPGGESRIYHYNSLKALTGITDANGDRFATWAYDIDGRAISSEHNGGTEKVTIDYTDIDDPTDPRAVATNVLGKQTTYHFADVFGARKIVQVEGHQSTNCAAANKNYSYDANGFMASKTDWKGNTTTYIRNTKGQELSRTEAFGTPDARTITTEWHPTFNLRTKVTEPDRETNYNYDANGNLLSQQTTDLLMP